MTKSAPRAMARRMSSPPSIPLSKISGRVVARGSRAAPRCWPGRHRTAGRHGWKPRARPRPRPPAAAHRRAQHALDDERAVPVHRAASADSPSRARCAAGSRHAVSNSARRPCRRISSISRIRGMPCGHAQRPRPGRSRDLRQQRGVSLGGWVRPERTCRSRRRRRRAHRRSVPASRTRIPGAFEHVGADARVAGRIHLEPAVAPSRGATSSGVRAGHGGQRVGDARRSPPAPAAARRRARSAPTCPPARCPRAGNSCGPERSRQIRVELAMQDRRCEQDLVQRRGCAAAWWLRSPVPLSDTPRRSGHAPRARARRSLEGGVFCVQVMGAFVAEAGIVQNRLFEKLRPVPAKNPRGAGVNIPRTSLSLLPAALSCLA